VLLLVEIGCPETADLDASGQWNPGCIEKGAFYYQLERELLWTQESEPNS